MIRLTQSQVQPIGLDLGLDSIKLLQLEVVGETLSVVAAAKRMLPDDVRGKPELALPVASELLRSALRDGDFVGRNVIACLPRGVIHTKNLRLPMMPAAEIESAVQFEAKNVFPFDTDKSVVRHLIAGEVRQGNESRLEVIALAAKLDEVNGFVEQLHRCGCIVESLDFEPCAIYRGIEKFIRRREDEQEVNAIVDIGSVCSQVIIGKGRDISFFKPLEIGAVHLHDAVARKLDISLNEARALRQRIVDQPNGSEDSSDSVRQAVQDAARGVIEQLAREISLCLRYYSVTFRGHKPSKIRILGGEGSDPQVLSILAGALPLPVEPGRPLSSVNVAKMERVHRQANMGEWAVAFGTGLKLTKGYFGSRDGKRREPAALQPKADAAEVVDFDRTVASAGTDARPGTGQEVARA